MLSSSSSLHPPCRSTGGGGECVLGGEREGRQRTAQKERGHWRWELLYPPRRPFPRWLVGLGGFLRRPLQPTNLRSVRALSFFPKDGGRRPRGGGGGNSSSCNPQTGQGSGEGDGAPAAKSDSHTVLPFRQDWGVAALLPCAPGSLRGFPASSPWRPTSATCYQIRSPNTRARHPMPRTFVTRRRRLFVSLRARTG